MRTAANFALGLILFTSACQPPESTPLTLAEREAIADTIRGFNQALWQDMTSLTPESFERQMAMWIEDPSEFFVGDPGVWVSMTGITSTPEEVRANWEPVVGQRQGQHNEMVQEHVAVISRDAALHVYKATFAITNAEGETGEPAPWTVSMLWVRTPDGWRILHYHQSWTSASS